MKNAYIIDAIPYPHSDVMPVDSLQCVPMTWAPCRFQALMQRNPSVDWTQVDDVIYGCANQAGEDNRNVGRMSALLAGLPVEVPSHDCKPFMWFITRCQLPWQRVRLKPAKRI